MNMAILYICTGRYTVFWDAFFVSAEQNFLPGAQKRYFVFTDGEINYSDTEKVVHIYQENLGWPGNTLKRFEMFWRIADRLASFDYIFFCNANMLFVDVIEENILPTREQGVVVTQHPGFYNKSVLEFTYERNPKSRAYIAPGKGNYYVCGGFNGGHAFAYLAMVDELRQAINEDERRGIVALWHDESHLNRFILDHPYKLLGPDFCVPEGWDLPVRKKILVRDKNNFGGHDFLRGERKTLMARIAVLIRDRFPSTTLVGRVFRKLKRCIAGSK
jgi:hypothetical protein